MLIDRRRWWENVSFWMILFLAVSIVLESCVKR